MERNVQVALGTFLAGALLGAAWLASPRSGSGRVVTPEATQGNVIHVNAASFPGLLAQGKPVLVDFWAPWCGPCRTQGPILEQVSQQLGDQAIIAKVNVDDERQLAAQYGVRSIPTLVLLRDGKVVKQFVGVQQAETLVKAMAGPTS